MEQCLRPSNKGFLTIVIDHESLEFVSSGEIFPLIDDILANYRTSKVVIDLNNVVYLSKSEIMTLNNLVESLHLLAPEIEYTGMSHKLSLSITTQGVNLASSQISP